jgi:hypothetical protein
MRPNWKKIVIGSEVTVLAAFTGAGVYLAVQPHRAALVAPPPLFAPSIGSGIFPLLHQTAQPSPRPAASPSGLTPAWVGSLNHEDRSLMTTQWDIIQRLTRAVEQYLEHQVIPAMQRSH